MKATFLLFISLALNALEISAQLPDPSFKSPKDIITEFARANGGQLPATVHDPAKATVYITFDNTRGIVLAASNFQSDTGSTNVDIIHLQNGMLDPAEIERLFKWTEQNYTVETIPVWIHNDVFRVFLDTRFLDRYKNVALVSGDGKRYPVRNRMAELRPGFFVMLGIEVDNYVSFTFERGFDPAKMEAYSLLNNKEVNKTLAAVFPDFQAIRTDKDIEKAFSKSKEQTICLFAHISADGQLIRYRSSGEVSYELPAMQFFHLAGDLHKEVILIGVNYADDTSRTLDPAAEVKLLEEALKNRNWGAVLQHLGSQGNQVQVSEPNTDGFYFKRADISRPEGVKPARAYTFVFFKTPSKPPAYMVALRFVYGHSGKILSVLVALQLLFFFVFKGNWAHTWKWVNAALLFIFLFAFLFSFM